MEKAVPRLTDRAQHKRGILFALRELVQVLWAWASGEGDLIGLLVAGWQVVTGKVVTE